MSNENSLDNATLRVEESVRLSFSSIDNGTVRGTLVTTTTTMPVAPDKARRSASMSSVQRRPPKSCLSRPTSEPMLTSAGMNRRVSFDRVEIREYERVLTDNPAVTGGPAIGIGWQYEPLATLEVDRYEASCPPRRQADEFRMPPHVRTSLLLKSHKVSKKSIQDATRQAERIKRQRRETVAAMELEPAQILMGSLTRKLKRLVKLAPTTQQEQEQLWENARRRTVWNTRKKQPLVPSSNDKDDEEETDNLSDSMPDAVTLHSDSTVDDEEEVDDDDDVC